MANIMKGKGASLFRSHLRILLTVAFLLVIMPGCHENNDQDGAEQGPPASLPEMDYATFKSEVINHQVEAVVIYPEDHVMTVVTKKSGLIYRVSYDEMVITDTGTSLTGFLANNRVPFTIEEPRQDKGD